MGDQHESPAAGLLIPLGQALVTGILVGVCSWALARLAGWPDPGSWGAGAGALATTAAWLQLLARWHRVLEAALGVDLEPPRAVSAETLERVRVDLVSKDGHRGQFIDLPADQEQLVQLGAGIVAGGQSFSLASFGGRGKVFSRTEFERLRDAFLTRGLARWKNPAAPTQGLELSPAGRALCRRFAAMAPTPPQLVERRRARADS